MLTVEVIYIHFCQTELKMNSQLSFQHVHNEPVYPASFDQVPGQASEMPGGAQQIIFVMFLQVLISGSVYLYTKRRVKKKGQVCHFTPFNTVNEPVFTQRN